ncbi:hypothetical protein AB0K43_06375 [Kitasatospora sp. NPDC049258]|uniref:hypothetical protein n=1 Tax=Kitasatospora sp. NPDC049258 TaxID=3155394 RepID=UPI003413591B
MSVRRVLCTVATAAVAALALTGCDPSGDTGGRAAAPAASTPAGGTPGASTGAASSPAAGTGTPKATTDPGDPGAEPGADCGAPPKPAAGHRMLNVSKASSATVFYAKETRFECDPNDGHWADAGAEKPYTFAAGAVAELTDLSFRTTKVTLAQLAQHTAKCLDHTEDPEKRPCFTNLTYEVVLDASGKVTKVSEKFHS